VEVDGSKEKHSMSLTSLQKLDLSAAGNLTQNKARRIDETGYYGVPLFTQHELRHQLIYF